MSLTTQNWRKLAIQTLTAGTINNLLDAIYTAYTSATYYNGNTRTAGAASAWTFSRFQNLGVTEAVYGTPPTDTLNHRAIFAGATGAPTPTMASPDTFLASTLLMSINKNSGAFNAWDAASPFTSGQFFGYWRGAPSGSLAIGARVHCYESQECLGVFVEDIAGAVYCGFLGALWDPESSDTTSDAESDSKLYGVITSGSSGAIEAAFGVSDGGVDDFMTQAGTSANGGKHVGSFTPGAGTLETMLRLGAPNISTTTSLRSRAGRYYRVPILHYKNSAAPNDRLIGRLREIFAFTDAQLGQVYQESGTDKGYLVGGSSTVDQDCVYLAAS